MRHKWRDENDRALRECFGTTRGHAGWWAAVVGRCGLAVSPDAARSRWERLRADDAEVAAAEARAAQPPDDRLERIEKSIAELHGLMREPARAWGIAC